MASTVQLDREAVHLGERTIANTTGVILRVLGFIAYIARRVGQPSLAWLLSGPSLAAFTAFGTDVRCVDCSACPILCADTKPFRRGERLAGRRSLAAAQRSASRSSE